MKLQLEWSNPLVYRILRDCGWTADRAIDAHAWILALEEEGYAVFAEARQILANFGGLRIVPPDVVPGAKFGASELLLDPVWAATGERQRIIYREQQLRCRLVPLGEWCGEAIVLLADDGRVFAETTFKVLQLAKTFAEAIQNVIVRDQDLQEVATQ